MASFAEKSRALIEALAALEIIAAFEGGEDRASALQKAWRLRSEPFAKPLRGARPRAPTRGWDGLPYGLVSRLMKDRDGADVDAVIPTRVGDDLTVEHHAGWLTYTEWALIQGTYIDPPEDESILEPPDDYLFLVFDEQIAVYAKDTCGQVDVIYCSRSSAFEKCLPKMHENESWLVYQKRVRAWARSPDSSIPVVTPTRVSLNERSAFYEDISCQGEAQAEFMCHIEALCQECGTHGLIACVGPVHGVARRFRSTLAERCRDDNTWRRARAQAAFQELLLKLYTEIPTGFEMPHTGFRPLDAFPPVGALRRRAVRGLLARLRALVDKGRATCLRDGFLYEAAPAGVFRLVVSFL